MLLAVGVGPVVVEIAPDQKRIDDIERAADIFGEIEVSLPAASIFRRVKPIVENAADAPRLVAVLQVEIFVAPLLETGIVGDI